MLASRLNVPYHGRRAHLTTSAATRIRTLHFGEMLVFLINAGLFIVAGLQLPGILEGLAGSDGRDLVLAAVMVTAVVIGARVLWVGGFTIFLRALKSPHAWAQPLPAAHAVIESASGMRRAVSLAAALAIPLQVESGGPFPERELLIFLAFIVIVVTLVPQGLALPKLLEHFGLQGDEVVDLEDNRPRVLTRPLAATAAKEPPGARSSGP